MEEHSKSPTAVQDLIDQIREQGVAAARDEADQLLHAARRQAAEIIAQAKAEAEAERARARSEIEAHRAAARDALQLAARDTVLDLKACVMLRFKEFVRRLVVSATRSREVVRDIVLVLAGRAADDLIQDKDIEVRIARSLLTGTPELPGETKRAILGLSSDMLREGLELAPDDEIEGGVRVRLVNDKLELDLSDRAVAQLISRRLLPRFKAILDGDE